MTFQKLRICFWAAGFCLPALVSAQSYSLRKDLDIPLVAGLLAMKYHSSSLLEETREVPLVLSGLHRQNVPGFDRWAIGFYSPRLSSLSSTVAGAALALPVAVNLWDTYQGRQAWYGSLVDVLLLQEALMLSSSLSSYAKSFPVHSTPLTYDPAVPESEKMVRQNASSFFSNHTASAFTAAVYSAYTFQLKHSDSPLVPWVWGGSMALATGVGSLRVLAGKHFPSDVLAGAAVGALCGYLVPRLHKGKSRNWDLGLAMPAGSDIPTPVLQFKF